MNKCKLNDIAVVLAGQSPKSEFYNTNGAGIPFLQGNRTFGRLYPYFDTYTTKTTKKALAGDILMSVRAPVGDLNIAPVDLCIGRGLCSIRRKNGDQMFLYYYLKNSMKQLRMMQNGTTFDSVNRDDIEQFELNIPDDATQVKISKVLTNIDEKVETNSQINAELESLAKTIYDYWFLQFDFPNKEGKPYKSSGGAMVWNEDLKMEIPKGWETRRLEDMADLYLGGTPKTEISSYWNGDINWLSSGEISQFPVVLAETKITEDGVNNSATKLMQKGTVVVSITGNIRVSILAIDSCANQSVVGINENGILKNSYIYPVVGHLLDHYGKLSTGNCQQHINKNTLEKTIVVVPPRDVLDKYYAAVNPIYELIMNTALESQTLKETRDFLLPLLMNGQVEVV